jgi:hypothetical protein
MMRTIKVVMLSPKPGDDLDEFITEQEQAMITNPPEGDVVSCFMNLGEHHFARMLQLVKNTAWTQSVWCDYESEDHTHYHFFWLGLDEDTLLRVVEAYADQHNQTNPKVSFQSPVLH